MTRLLSRLAAFGVLLIAAAASAQEEENLFLSVDAGFAVGYTPWKSFNGFRKEYNTTNAETLDKGLGSLSMQYGFSVGADVFVQSHFYAGFDYYRSHAQTAAKFENGAKRVMAIDVNTLTTFIGWLQPTAHGYWTLSTGVNSSFGMLHSTIQFADGTRYTHTGGYSGEFHDLAFGFPLKFEWNRNLTERATLRFGAQLNFYLQPFELGMQNSFVTMTSGSIVLNDKQINYDVSSGLLFCGFSYKIVRQ